MKKLSLRFPCLLLAGMVAFASAQAQQTVTGKIAAQSNSEPIAGAIVTLVEHDSIPTMQTQTDADGRFSLTSKEQGNLLLQITMMGYEPEALAIVNNEKKIDLGNIFLSESAVQLDDVTVYGSRIIRKVDKYIVLPSAEQLASSAQSIDLFAQLQLPQLSVNSVTREITVANETPAFLINGRSQPLQRILNIDPKQILRIEYSDMPGIRYSDKGYSGVINVVLRDPVQGGSVYISAGSGLQAGNIDGTVQASYNYKKSEFIVGYTGGWRNYDEKSIDSWERYISPDGIISREQQGYDSEQYYQQHFVSLEYNYVPQLNTLFSARFTTNILDQSSTDDGRIFEQPWNAERFEYDKFLSNKWDQASPAIDLFFTKKLKNDQSIEANVSGSYSSNTYGRDLRYVYADGTVLQLPTNSDGKGWGAAAELVYKKNFKKVAFQIGAQYARGYDKNEYLDGQMSEQKKDNFYAYAEVQGSIKKWSYVIGTGLKVLHTNTNGKNLTQYGNHSTLRLNYPIAKNLTFGVHAGFGPNMPSLSALSPVEQAVDNHIIWKGNPNLKIWNYLDYGASLFYNNPKGFVAYFSAGHWHGFNPIFTTTTYDTGRQCFIESPNNERYISQIGLHAEVGYMKLWDHLDVSVVADYQHMRSAGHTFDHHKKNSIRTRFNARFTYNKWTVAAQLPIHTHKNLFGETISQSGRVTSLSVQFAPKRNLFLTASVNYLFEKKGSFYIQEGVSAVHPYWSESVVRDCTNLVRLQLVYNFSFGERLQKAKRKFLNSGYESGVVKN